MLNFDSNHLTELGVRYGTRILGVLVLLTVAWIVAGLLQRMTSRAFEKAKLDVTLAKFFSNLTRYTVLAIAVISCLSIFGIQTTSFAAVLAAAGFAIGMAFQGTLSNFSSGVMLLVFRPFKIGQIVNVAGQTGKVDEIALFTTTLDTPDNRRIILPNSSIFGSTIENISHHSTRRVDVSVGTAYDADLKQTRQTLSAIFSTFPEILKDPEPVVVLTQLGDSAISWQLRAWCNAEDYWALREKLLEATKVALDKQGIGIPFPQMDIHVNTASAPLPL